MSTILSASSPEHVHAPDDGYIQVLTGRFYASAPRFDIRDIAWSLPSKPRFSGFTKRPYSVADHSVLVSYLMEDLGLGNPLEGQLHDATEAYLPDIPSPWKRLLPDYRAFEKGLETKMREHFGLPKTKSEGCSKADWLALYIEGEALLPAGTADFVNPYGFREEAMALQSRYSLSWFFDIGPQDFLRIYNLRAGKSVSLKSIIEEWK